MKTIRRISLAVCGLFLVALPSVVSAHPANAPALVVTSVSPNHGLNYQATPITITGSNFVAAPIVRLGTVSLGGIVFENSTTLTAIVPADLPVGEYAIAVTNPDNQSASLASAFTV